MDMGTIGMLALVQLLDKSELKRASATTTTNSK
jgi:hypothetical protein